MNPRWLATLAALALSACAPFSANWYHVGDIDKEPTGVLLAVMNQGSSACRVTRIELNPTWRAGPSTLSWSPASSTDGVWLGAGEVVIIPTREFVSADAQQRLKADASCTVPMSIKVHADRCTPGDLIQAFDVRVSGRLPNALPESWAQMCMVKRAAAGTEDAASQPPQ